MTINLRTVDLDQDQGNRSIRVTLNSDSYLRVTVTVTGIYERAVIEATKEWWPKTTIDSASADMNLRQTKRYAMLVAAAAELAEVIENLMMSVGASLPQVFDTFAVKEDP